MMSLISAIALSTSFASATEALDGRDECVAFQWHKGAKSKKGAISLPVVVDGQSMRWQLDTGADVNMSYGAAADQAGLSKADDSRFKVHKLSIGGASLDDTLVFIRREMNGADDVTGTLGLNSIVGKIAVIDYPRQRFCLFNEANLPAAFKSANYAKAILRDRKFFVPVTLGDFRSEAIFFDTGASEVPLEVDRNLWTRLTGKASPEQAETRIAYQAWGSTGALFGARSSDAMQVGDISLGNPMIYAEQTDHTFASRSYKVDGVMGNAPFLHGLVILDLTVRMQFGFIGR